MNSNTAVVDLPIARRTPSVEGAKGPITAGAARAGYLVDVSRPAQPWQWRNVLLAPFELLAVAWSIPFIILVIGIPVVLLVALVHAVGRFFVR